ncbi:MAG: thymidine kinase [Oscillospiraceae bacterium]|nr:thymidine kinase [Oscillospiraceae bacterium]
MAKLYFKYGAMGSSKSAQALITKYNYEERGMKVWLIKPKTDTRDGQNILKSRIGLYAVADEIALTDSIKECFKEHNDCNVIIADEAQFLSPEQIDELRDIVDEMNIPVMCFGLRTDFITKLFPGSMRLFEVADSISEIKTICDCGSKATVNARMDDNGNIVTAGDQICIGGNDRYIAMCHKCWKKAIAEQK